MILLEITERLILTSTIHHNHQFVIITKEILTTIIITIPIVITASITSITTIIITIIIIWSSSPSSELSYVQFAICIQMELRQIFVSQGASRFRFSTLWAKKYYTYYTKLDISVEHIVFCFMSLMLERTSILMSQWLTQLLGFLPTWLCSELFPLRAQVRIF